MQTSPTLLSKISGTKKRLSESVITDSVLSSLALCALLLILTYAGRAIFIGGSWGLITLDIPVVSRPFVDKKPHGYMEQPASNLTSTTMVVALTTTELIFGDLNAFTSQKNDLRNKFIVPHKEGSPQVKTMLNQVNEWTMDRKNRLSIRDDKLVILVPDPRIPMPVVSGVVNSLRDSKKFSHVVLGGGVL